MTIKRFIESSQFRMSHTVNCDNHEVVLSDCLVRVSLWSPVTLSGLQSISYWQWRRQNLSDSSQQLSDWFQLGGLSAAADGGGSGDYTVRTAKR